MAEIKVSGRMEAGTLKEQFNEAFGSTLRVYKSLLKGSHFADDDATLASIRDESASEKAGEVLLNPNLRVGTVEAIFEDVYGIKVQVASPDNSKLADNDKRLSETGA